MKQHTESAFETTIEAALLASGWLQGSAGPVGAAGVYRSVAG
jgi:hypothetical protein